MSHIAALKGVGNSGKSTTIKEVFALLKAKYPMAKINVIESSADIKIIMTINGKKVGIESQGDPNSRLKDSLADFVKAKCDIIICATRSRGMTVDWVKKYKATYKIDFIDQPHVAKNHQASTNTKSANLIISKAGL